MLTSKSSLLLSVGLLALSATPAAAQSLQDQPTPPTEYNLDENGVDLGTGKFIMPSSDVSIGGSDGGLSYDRSSRTAGYDDRYNTALNAVGTEHTVTIGTTSDIFDGPNGSSTVGTGAQLSSPSAGVLVYTMQDGIRYTFEKRVFSTQHRVAQYRATYISYPDGRSEMIEYDIRSSPSWHVTRPSAVQSNDGYRLVFRYQADTLEGSGPERFSRFMNMTGVTASNSAVEHCASAASCPPGGSTWASVQYAWDASGTIQTRKDALGRESAISVDSGGRIIGVRPAGASANAVTLTYDGDRVKTLTTGTGTWTYGSGGATVTSPTGQQSEVLFGWFGVSSVRVGTGGTTSYERDSKRRVTKVIAPEGNATRYDYDARDNIVSAVTTSKNGATSRTTLASYPANCTNMTVCNKPLTTTDLRGQVTEYEYDQSHGGILKVTRPAPTPGTPRPQTRYNYQQFFAWYKNANGVLTQGPSPIWKLVSISECATGDASTCIGTASETRTEISYGTPGTPNNLHPTSITVRAGDHSVSATRTMTYDRHGNVVAVDGPLPGTADTSFFRYNLAREMTGVISPDPDGAGPLKHRANRIGRDEAGRVTTTEVGTVAGPSDSEWANYSVHQARVTSFDPVTRLPTQDAVIAGGNTQQLTQYGHDADGRLRCTAVRIGRTAAADPCQQLGNEYSGYDQLAETMYGPDGRVWKRREGGVDTVSLTYTPNGRLASFIDGENNRTGYEYDGFDRLAKVSYPVLTKGAGQSSTLDYEQFGYGADDNVVSRRVRDGQVIGYDYDALGRLTSKDLPNAFRRELDATYGYDNLGRLTRAGQNNSIQLSFGYDALGRLVSEGDDFFGTKRSTYDAAGRRTRLTWVDGFFVDYDYLTTGEMTRVREYGATGGVGVLAAYGYDDLGRRTSLARGNGTITYYAYDPASRLQRLSHDLVSTTHDQTYTFVNDALGRIAQRTASNDAYVYTPWSEDLPQTANGLNQVVTAGAYPYRYDGRGNFHTDDYRTYTYTAENHMIAASGQTELGYDPLGRLYYLTAGNTFFARSDGTVIAETDGVGTVRRRFVHGPGVDEVLVQYEGAGTADRRFLHADERGSIVAISDGSGSGTAINRYDEYGLTHFRQHVGRFGYTGQLFLPELGGLYDYKARIYAPGLSFMQPDPIGYGDGPNLYAYVGGDPVNRTDPTGLCQTATTACVEEVVVTGTRPSGSARGGGGSSGIPEGAAPPTVFSYAGLMDFGQPALLASAGQPAPKRRSSPSRAKQDYCGSTGSEGVPDGNWGDACKRHDQCYSTPGASKELCDIKLARDIVAECSGRVFVPAACALVGAVYGGFLILDGINQVFSFSRRAYNDAQRSSR